MSLTILEESPATPDAAALLEELSDALQAITGSSGRASFDPEDVQGPRALFAVARDGQGRALGCGALRPLAQDIAEIKRVYARTGGAGVGSAILAHLERRAREMGYRAIWLETRAVNHNAVRFYEKHGYHRIENYGKYAGRAEAVCFEKRLFSE